MPFVPSTTSSTDPFTVVYQAIYNGLANFTDFTAIVKLANPNNLIHFDGLANPIKDKRNAADLPEVVLMQSKWRAEPYAVNSIACGIWQTYPIVATAADLNIIPVNQLKYQTIRALDSLGSKLGVSFVRLFRLTDSRDLPASSAPGRGIDRWQSILDINVEMAVPKPLASI